MFEPPAECSWNDRPVGRTKEGISLGAPIVDEMVAERNQAMFVFAVWKLFQSYPW